MLKIRDHSWQDEHLLDELRDAGERFHWQDVFKTEEPDVAPESELRAGPAVFSWFGGNEECQAATNDTVVATSEIENASEDIKEGCDWPPPPAHQWEPPIQCTSDGLALDWNRDGQVDLNIRFDPPTTVTFDWASESMSDHSIDLPSAAFSFLFSAWGCDLAA